jgi:hypothetical protein
LTVPWGILKPAFLFPGLHHARNAALRREGASQLP